MIDRVGGRREHHVGLVDPAGGGVDHVDGDLVLRQLRDLVLERLERAGDVGLEQQVELLDLALLGLGEDVLEGDPARLAAGQRLGLEAVRALAGELAGLAVVLDDLDALAGLADAVEAEHLDRVAGPGLLDPLALEVVHRADPAPRGPATTASPTFSVPRWTRTVATGPRPGSRWDSITVPEAGAFGFAFSSSSSVTSRIISSRLSRPSWVFAETSQ